MDALSDVMSAVRLTSSAFLDARFTAPWCIASQIGPEDCTPFGPTPAQIIAYHYLIAGHLFLQLDGESPIEVCAGEIILLPRNDRHALGSAPRLAPALIDHLIQPPDGTRPAMLQIGGGGEETHLICGFLGCDVPDNPLIAALPAVLRLNAREGAGGAWIGDSFRRAAEEFTTGGAGSTTVLSKLAELLFVEAVRRYLATLPEAQTGWLAGLRDAKVGKALAVLHTRPAHAWTTDELAQAVGMSRSAFAERFTSLVGMPPMRYLTRWRLQLSAVRLRESPRSLGQIAYEVGYESEAAFSRAFKSTFGTTPGDWRQRKDRSSDESACGRKSRAQTGLRLGFPELVGQRDAANLSKFRIKPTRPTQFFSRVVFSGNSATVKQAFIESRISSRLAYYTDAKGPPDI